MEAPGRVCSKDLSPCFFFMTCAKDLFFRTTRLLAPFSSVPWLALEAAFRHAGPLPLQQSIGIQYQLKSPESPPLFPLLFRPSSPFPSFFFCSARRHVFFVCYRRGGFLSAFPLEKEFVADLGFSLLVKFFFPFLDMRRLPFFPLHGDPDADFRSRGSREEVVWMHSLARPGPSPSGEIPPSFLGSPQEAADFNASRSIGSWVASFFL